MTLVARCLKTSSCAGLAKEDVGGLHPLPPGFSHILHKRWVEYGMQCPTHGLKRVGSYDQLERKLRRHAVCRCEGHVSRMLLSNVLCPLMWNAPAAYGTSDLQGKDL